MSSLLIGAVLLGTLATVRIADAASAQVRWMPSTSTGVVGYSVYVRNAGSPYGSPAWSGNPSAAGDGTFSTTVTYTPASSGVNYFAVVARSDLGESNISQELPIGAPNPCRVDACATKASCTFSSRPDGVACDDALFCNGPEVCRSGVCDTSASRDCADSVGCTVDQCQEVSGTCTHVGPPGCCLACDETTDPCLADACLAGDCLAAPGIEIEVNRVRLLERASGLLLAGKGSFTADPSVDPTVTGAIVELRALDGQLIYASTIRPESIRKGAAKGRYRFAVSKAQSKFLGNGITRLDFRVKNSTWLVTLKAQTPLLNDALLEPSVTWVLRLGETCLRRIGMPCDQGEGSAICR